MTNSQQQMSARQLRDTFGCFATGVTVVTCRTPDGAPHGATVNAFTAVSLEPALAQVTLTRTSRAGQLLQGRPFAINILAADQIDLAWHFAGRAAEQEPCWVEGATAPLIRGAAATISCTPWRSYDGGDHFIVIGQVVQAETTEADPLLFYRGAFRQVRPMKSGHWSGSADCPELGWFDSDSIIASRSLSRTPARTTVAA
ncbi:MAG: flavin reductase family protein [Propionibacteriaceae bacterium]